MDDEIQLIVPPVRPKNMKVWQADEDSGSYVLVDLDQELEDFTKFMESISRLPDQLK